MCICVRCSDRTQQPLHRVSLTADRLDSKLNTLLIQSVNADNKPMTVGVLTSETLFRHWDEKNSKWNPNACQVVALVVVVVVVAVVLRGKFVCWLVCRACHTPLPLSVLHDRGPRPRRLSLWTLWALGTCAFTLHPPSPTGSLGGGG